MGEIQIGQGIRQGDVLLRRIGALPKNVQRHKVDSGRIVVEYGEVTGHAHVLDPLAVEGYDILDEARMVVGQAFVVLADTELRHDEHGPITLDRGTIWERWYQVEDDGEEERRVRD